MATITFSDSEFRSISELMFDAVGLSFNDSKKSLIQSRLAPHPENGARWFSDYIDCCRMRRKRQSSRWQSIC
jgi:hypothetical protein